MTPLQSFHASRTCQSRVHCDACRASQDWRASAGKRHGLAATARHWGCPRPGLGDALAWLIRVTGAKRLWQRVTKRTSCGSCAKRRRALNYITGA